MPISITVTATDDFITINDVPCRMWDGTTANGIRIQAAIVRIAPIGGANPAFEAECTAAGLRPPTHPENVRQVVKDV